MSSTKSHDPLSSQYEYFLIVLYQERKLYPENLAYSLKT